MFARFAREVELTQTLAHSGIVRVLEAGTHHVFLERLEGESLDTRLHPMGSRLPLREVHATLSAALEVMAHAHAKDRLSKKAHEETIGARGEVESLVMKNPPGFPVVEANAVLSDVAPGVPKAEILRRHFVELVDPIEEHVLLESPAQPSSDAPIASTMFRRVTSEMMPGFPISDGGRITATLSKIADADQIPRQRSWRAAFSASRQVRE